jgi:hypothetical protein
MARSAKCSASRLVRAENRPPGSAGSGEFASQIYSDAATRGPVGGHSARSPAGGLITAQFANDIVRDHRCTPSLLVTLNWCSCLAEPRGVGRHRRRPGQQRGHHRDHARPPDQQRAQQDHEQHGQQHQPDRPQQRRNTQQEGRHDRAHSPPLAR